MLTSGGKILAIDSVNTDTSVFSGNGADGPLGLNINGSDNTPFGYNPVTKQWEKTLSEGGNTGIKSVAHDGTLSGDGTSKSPLGINLAKAEDESKVYGIKKDGTLSEVSTEGKTYAAGDYIDSTKLANGVIAVTGLQTTGDYAYKTDLNGYATTGLVSTTSANAISTAKKYTDDKIGEVEGKISDAITTASAAAKDYADKTFQVKGDYATSNYVNTAIEKATSGKLDKNTYDAFTASLPDTYQKKGNYVSATTYDTFTAAYNVFTASLPNIYQSKGDYVNTSLFNAYSADVAGPIASGAAASAWIAAYEPPTQVTYTAGDHIKFDETELDNNYKISVDGLHNTIVKKAEVENNVIDIKQTTADDGTTTYTLSAKIDPIVSNTIIHGNRGVSAEQIDETNEWNVGISGDMGWLSMHINPVPLTTENASNPFANETTYDFQYRANIIFEKGVLYIPTNFEIVTLSINETLTCKKSLNEYYTNAILLAGTEDSMPNLDTGVNVVGICRDIFPSEVGESNINFTSTLKQTTAKTVQKNGVQCHAYHLIYIGDIPEDSKISITVSVVTEVLGFHESTGGEGVSDGKVKITYDDNPGYLGNKIVVDGFSKFEQDDEDTDAGKQVLLKLAPNSNVIGELPDKTVPEYDNNTGKTNWVEKQDKLTPGDGIVIEDNKISVKIADPDKPEDDDPALITNKQLADLYKAVEGRIVENIPIGVCNTVGGIADSSKNCIAYLFRPSMEFVLNKDTYAIMCFGQEPSSNEKVRVGVYELPETGQDKDCAVGLWHSQAVDNIRAGSFELHYDTMHPAYEQNGYKMEPDKLYYVAIAGTNLSNAQSLGIKNYVGATYHPKTICWFNGVTVDNMNADGNTTLDDSRLKVDGLDGGIKAYVAFRHKDKEVNK